MSIYAAIRACADADDCRHGKPPLSNPALYDSANFALSILPTRLAHRIQCLRNLPFIVVTNPNISRIHDNYMHSLSTILPFAEKSIDTIEDESQFTEALAGVVNTHSNTIPVLAQGLLEARKYISPGAVTTFLDEHLRARIGTRMIAEQHIALHYSSQRYEKGNGSSDYASYIGVIDTAMQPAKVIRNCEAFVAEICELRYGVRPTVVIDGVPDASIAQVPVHLEYIITELLKNAFRATIEKGNESQPVQITIAPGLELPTPKTEFSSLDQGSQSQDSSNIQPLGDPTPGVTIRIRDQGGGIDPEHLKNIWNYSFTTFDDAASSSGSGIDGLNVISGSSANGSSLAGLGYGLPLSRAYAEYFGGGITVQSLWGWGTDVYLCLRGVGKIN